MVLLKQRVRARYDLILEFREALSGNGCRHHRHDRDAGNKIHIDIAGMVFAKADSE